MNANIVWCHGSLSQPWGGKSKAMAETASALGMTMGALDFQDLEEPDARVDRLVQHLGDTPTIVAGSSMGGYVAAAAARHSNILGLFLLAPAFYLPGYAVHVFSNLPPDIWVVHGWNDDAVPAESSIRFAGQHKASLHMINDDHRLSANVDHVAWLFGRFLETVQSRQGGDAS